MADKKGEEYLAQAEKKLKSSQGFLGSLLGGSQKVDEALELYIKAANSFKMSKNWIAAGKAFCEAAKVNLQQNVKHEAASNYNDAATCFKKSDANEAVNCLLKSVEIYTDMGRFSIAAKQHVAIAETYESELEDKDKAIQHYEQAADYYQGEESNSHANKCLLKVAEMSALMERYEKALEIYERVAKQCADNNLLKYTARDHLFRAGVCRMCLDNEDAKQSLSKYEAMVPQFADSRECKLLKTLTTAVEEGNADAFTAALQEWDAMTKFDAWFTTLFLRVKKHHLSGQDDLK